MKPFCHVGSRWPHAITAWPNSILARHHQRSSYRYSLRITLARMSCHFPANGATGHGIIRKVRRLWKQILLGGVRRRECGRRPEAGCGAWEIGTRHQGRMSDQPDVGERRPLGVPNAGIAILSGMQPEAARDLLAKNRSRLVRYGLSTEAILHEVVVARAKGFAARATSLIPGVSSVSVTIRSPCGSAQGTLSITPIPRRLELCGILGDEV